MPSIPFITETETKVQFPDEHGTILAEVELIDLEMMLEDAIKAERANPSARNLDNSWRHRFAKSLSLLFQRDVGASRAVLIADAVSKHFRELKKNFETLSTLQNSTDSVPATSPPSNSVATFETSLDSSPSENSAPVVSPEVSHPNDSMISC